MQSPNPRQTTHILRGRNAIQINNRRL